MTENEALERHKEDFRRCSFKVCKIPDNATECLQEIDIKVYEELLQYHSIGTVEECRDAVEKQKAKNPVEYEDKYYACPVCKNVLMYKWEKYPSKLIDKKNGLPYCLSCGQHISWEEARLAEKAADTIESLSEKLAESNNGGWIPCSERLPEEKINPITLDFCEYQVTFQSEDVRDVRHYKFGNGHWWNCGKIVDKNVTAWRLPIEPYQ